MHILRSKSRWGPRSTQVPFQILSILITLRLSIVFLNRHRGLFLRKYLLSFNVGSWSFRCLSMCCLKQTRTEPCGGFRSSHKVDPLRFLVCIWILWLLNPRPCRVSICIRLTSSSHSGASWQSMRCDWTGHVCLKGDLGFVMLPIDVNKARTNG